MNAIADEKPAIRGFSTLARPLLFTSRRLFIMKSNLIKNTLKGIGLSAFMAFGLIAFSSVEAKAQYQNRDYNQDRRDDRQDRRDDRQDRRDNRDNRNDDRYDRNRNNLYRVARDNGFRDGQNEARENRRDRDRNNPQRSNEYRRATNGYYSGLGSKDAYKDAYRQAFLEGYNSRSNRNGRGGWNNSGY